MVVDANRIHGNLAGAGDGGGIAVVNANGIDVAENLDAANRWWDVALYNNMITNNVAGRAGAITLQDSLEVHVQNNTIANNESTATAALAFTPGNPNQSNPLPAGVVSRVHGVDMAHLLLGSRRGDLPLNGNRWMEYLTFSDANLNNNILFGNRSFYWWNYGPTRDALTEFGLFPANCTTSPNSTCDLVNFVDYTRRLAVLDGIVDTGDEMFLRFNLLTSGPPDAATYSGSAEQYRYPRSAVPQPGLQRGQRRCRHSGVHHAADGGRAGRGRQLHPGGLRPLTIVELGSNPNHGCSTTTTSRRTRPPGTWVRTSTSTARWERTSTVTLRRNGGDNDIGADEYVQ